MNYDNTIRVAIVDDHAIVRQGLRNLLTRREIEVVGEAECGYEAVELAYQVNPDVMLLDIRMKGCDGLTALPKIRQASPNTQVIILTTYSNPTYFSQAIQDGACGYLLKDAEPDDIVQAIHLAVSRHHLFDPDLLSLVMQNTTPPPDTSDVDNISDDNISDDNSDHNPQIVLSDREREVLTLIMDGYSNAKIAEQLHLSLPTVKTHVTHILRKLDVKDRTQAVIIAMRHGFIN